MLRRSLDAGAWHRSDCVKRRHTRSWKHDESMVYVKNRISDTANVKIERLGSCSADAAFYAAYQAGNLTL